MPASALSFSLPERREYKYLLAYLVPLLPFIGIYLQGYWTFLTPLVLFGLLPAMELLLPGTTFNLDEAAEARARDNAFFDLLLYLNLPLLYGLLGYYFYSLSHSDYSVYEHIGLALSVGMACGAAGINVAHELGHRKPLHERLMAQALLLGSLYQHFFIEHNRGHHRHVATPLDPASARKGELVYTFWFRSMLGGWLSAWRLERQRLGKAAFSLRNLMLRFQLTQLAAVLLVGWVFSWEAAAAFVVVGLIGALLLESVNYLEHYGLQREELRSGVYEPVKPHHSWNSNHSLGRIMLYELTRHSDHHYRASRKYQVLRHHDQSPELPTGYPGMILLALVPPLWFKVMHKQLEREFRV